MNYSFLKYLLFLLLFFAVRNLYTQEFSKADEYKQVMENAKVAFEAHKYSEAIMFYKQAQELNPKSNLPRYKIEDIRTIYIERELAKSELQENSNEKLSKKEIAAKQEIEKKAEAEAERKMSEDAEKARKELEELRTEALYLNIDNEPDDTITEIEVQVLERTIETTGDKMESMSINEVNGLNETSTLKIQFEKQKLPDIIYEKEILELDIEADDLELVEVQINDIVPTLEVKKKTVEKPKVLIINKPDNKPQQKPISAMSPQEREQFAVAENERLIKKYPNTKTVEEIEKQGKHIIRIIMNIDNKVTVYLKVKHNWGAIYFFMDKPGHELQSINEVYYNNMTNLKTYGY